MIINQVSTKWKLIHFCFFAIVFILLAFKLNLIATILCVSTVLYTLSSLSYQCNKEKKNNKEIKMNNGKQKNNTKALKLFIISSIFATFISFGGEIYPKYLVGLILIILILKILHDITKHPHSDKKNLQSAK